MNSDEISLFEYDGDLTAGGLGGFSANGYVGFAWNVDKNADYSGPFNSIDATFAVPGGSRIIAFWAPPNKIVSSSELPFGFAYGPAGGAEFSFSYSSTSYNERLKSSWPW